MSSLSRRSLREKNIARRHLEQCVQKEIDDFISPNPIDQQIEREQRENLEYEMELGIYDDEDYEQQYADDYYWFEEQRQLREIDYDIDDDYDDYDDVYSTMMYLEVGSYYKDTDNRTFLCCQLINRDKVLINVHTGKEEYIPQHQLK